MCGDFKSVIYIIIFLTISIWAYVTLTLIGRFRRMFGLFIFINESRSSSSVCGVFDRNRYFCAGLALVPEKRELFGKMDYLICF